MFKSISRAHGVTGDIWLRHANPWSGWTRICTGLPMLILSAWSRVWLGWGALLPITVTALWMYINPRLFRPIATPRQWISKAVLGERVLAEGIAYPPKHKVPIRILTTLSGLFGLAMVVGLWILNLWLTIAAAALALTFKMWFLDRAVWLYEEVYLANPRVQSWTEMPNNQIQPTK